MLHIILVSKVLHDYSNVSMSPLDVKLDHHKVTLAIKFASIHPFEHLAVS